MQQLGISYLALTILSNNTQLDISQITKSIATTGCNIVATRLNRLGTDLAMYLLLSGNWNEIAKAEASIKTLEKKHDLKINLTRTLFETQTTSTLLYNISVLTADRPGVLNQLGSFLKRHHINIEEIEVDTFPTLRGTNMLNLSINIAIEREAHIASLREKFLTYCDTINLDASFEPIRELI